MRTGQTRWGSAVEALLNVAIGFAINFTANMLVLPLFFSGVTASKAFGIGLVFTVISVARSYILRRWFDGMLKFGRAPEPAGREHAP